ncbi:MAG: hypothetical protein LBT84_01435, partial [Spirochaetia bacterium]|nr:hypothetical protein [Spirochaetia bacterium]
KLINYCVFEQKLHGFVKFIIINKKDSKEVLSKSFNADHTEFLTRPIDMNEFLLLLEKTVLAERCRKMLRSLSAEQSGVLGSVECLLSIGRKNVFDPHGKGKISDLIDSLNSIPKERSSMKSLLSNYSVLRGNNAFHLKKHG